jgi:hypothetical protein
MKIGKRALRMSSGEIRQFRSKGARDRFENVARAIKHSPKFRAKMKRKRRR